MRGINGLGMYAVMAGFAALSRMQITKTGTKTLTEPHDYPRKEEQNPSRQVRRAKERQFAKENFK